LMFCLLAKEGRRGIVGLVVIPRESEFLTHGLELKYISILYFQFSCHVVIAREFRQVFLNTWLPVQPNSIIVPPVQPKIVTASPVHTRAPIAPVSPTVAPNATIPPSPVAPNIPPPTVIPTPAAVQLAPEPGECAECAIYTAGKDIGRRLPSCKKCHHYLSSKCHQSIVGPCSFVQCTNLSTCPTDHKESHKQQDQERARELRKEHGFTSKNLGTESKNKVETSYGLNSFLKMISETEPERAANGRKQAKKWSKALKSNSSAASSDDDDIEIVPPTKKRRVDSGHNDTAQCVLELSVAEIIQKINLEKKVEEGAVYRRTILEYMLKVKQLDEQPVAEYDLQ